MTDARDTRDDERAEIEEDLRTQGLDGQVSVDDVIATFGLHETMQPLEDHGPAPSPAFGEDWRYVPEPGEETLFADTADMHYPPE